MTTCGLCGRAYPAGDHCPDCAMTAGFGPNRPSPFRSGTLWAMAAGLVVVYAITLTVVAITS
ncbi:MAG: hypothetical protein FJW88_07050 [Actinobacteria bacterium]|nr:hypothetical protein [Actinomycetota bacterium]